MTEELNSRLSRLSGLGVIARTSSRQYKGTTKSIAQIGKELGADYLLRGTIRRERSPNADRVRITPQLVRASDGRSMWAEPYDKPYGSGIFEIQSDVAERVADALSVALLATERRAVNAKPTDNLKAYDRFLQAQALGARVESDWDAQRAALELYQEATRLDPTFASAYAGMLDVAQAIIASALQRQESRGAHQRTDFPKRDDQRFLAHSLAHRADDGTCRIEYKPVAITRWPPAERVYGR